MDVKEINLDQIFIDLSTLIGSSQSINQTLEAFHKTLSKHFELDQVYFCFNDHHENPSFISSDPKLNRLTNLKKFSFPNFLPKGSGLLDTDDDFHKKLCDELNLNCSYIFYYSLNENSCIILSSQSAFHLIDHPGQSFDLEILQAYFKNLCNYFELIRKKTEVLNEKTLTSQFPNLEFFKKSNLGFEELIIHIFRKAGVGLTYVNDGKFVLVNDFFANMLGYTKEEILNKKPIELSPDDSKDYVQSKVKSLINGSVKEISFVQPFLCKNKEVKYGSVKLTALNDNKGNYIGAFASVTDITEMTASQRALETSEYKYRKLFENSPYGIAYSNVEGKITMSSTMASKILGYGSKELIGKELTSIIIESDHQKIDATVQELIQGKEAIEKAYSIVTKSGGKRIVRVKSAAIRNDEKRIVGILNLFVDTTDNIKVKETLQKTKSSHELLYSRVFNGIMIYDYSKQEIIDANDSAIHMFAGTKRSLIGKNLDELIQHSSKYLDPDDSFNDLVEQKQKVLDGLLSNTLCVFKNLEGEEIIGDVSIIPFNSDEDKAYVIIKDLTDNYKVRQEIQERKLIYQSLIENSFDGIDILEFQTEGSKVNESVLIRNNKLNDIFSDIQGNFTRANELDKITPKFQANNVLTTEHFNYLLTELFQNKVVKSELRLQLKNGEILDTEIIFQILNVHDKTIIIRRFKDTSDKKLQQTIIAKQIKDLNEKNIQLEKYINSNLQLENFAYIASHDLKAPLRSLSSFAYLLKNSSEGSLDDKSKKFLDIILTSARHMQILIEDLLDFSRVNTQKLQTQEIVPAKLIRNVMTDIQKEIEQNDAIININTLPKLIVADEIKLFQLFLNLIRNAIKFQKEGGQAIIDISGAELNDHWEFHVRDNGIGIKKEHFEKIFNIFEKLHSNDVYEGTGLGLTICTKIVEQHDGDMSVKSKIDEGSTFSFTISKSLQKM